MRLLHRNSIRTRRSLSAVLIVTLASAFMVFIAIPTAEAASRNGNCDDGEFCYYHNSNNNGSVSDFPRSLGSIPNYGVSQPTCYEFKGRGEGEGECIKNDAASVWNRSSETVRVYHGSGYAGPHQDFLAGAKGNLTDALKNDNASHQFRGGTNAPAAPGDTLLPGQRLRPGDWLTSPSGQYRLVMQGDGNLVLFASGSGPIWASGTNGHGGASVTMQRDGNLVVTNSLGRPVWASGSHGNHDARLILQDDGNLVIYRGAPVWTSETARTRAFIADARWGHNGYGETITVRRNYDTGIHSWADLQSAFDEAITKSGYQGHRPDWVYRSLFAQFRCHDDLLAAQIFRRDGWELDAYVREVSYDVMTEANCNPRGPGISR